MRTYSPHSIASSSSRSLLVACRRTKRFGTGGSRAGLAALVVAVTPGCAKQPNANPPNGYAPQTNTASAKAEPDSTAETSADDNAQYTTAWNRCRDEAVKNAPAPGTPEYTASPSFTIDEAPDYRSVQRPPRFFRVRGYVQFTVPCSNGSQPGFCGRNETHHVVVAQSQDARSERVFPIHLAKDAHVVWPEVGSYTEFDVVKGLPDCVYTSVINVAHRAIEPPDVGGASPTYADGSWSVADAFEHVFPHGGGGPLSVTGYVAGGQFCPACPPEITCAPCFSRIELGDSYPSTGPRLYVEGASPDLSGQSAGGLGKRARVSGMLSAAASEADQARVLYYTHHADAPLEENDCELTRDSLALTQTKELSDRI